MEVGVADPVVLERADVGLVREVAVAGGIDRQGRAAYVAARAAQIPVARTGLPEDIANAVSFFVGEAAGFVSGQVLYVAGGPKA